MSKTISFTLTVSSISNAIRELERYQQSLETKTARLVDVLTDGACEMARFAFAGWGNVSKISEGGTGIVEVVGDHIIIGEFGAGLATMENHPLVENAPVPVYKWSYSELVGSGEGFLTERWHFGGQEYVAVEPRHGMLDARDYVINNLESKAREVFSR